jgi:hypothetical protein
MTEFSTAPLSFTESDAESRFLVFLEYFAVLSRKGTIIEFPRKESSKVIAGVVEDS